MIQENDNNSSFLYLIISEYVFKSFTVTFLDIITSAVFFVLFSFSTNKAHHGLKEGIWRLIISVNNNVWFFSGVTVLLSLTVFSIMVTEMLPKVSDAVPILG